MTDVDDNNKQDKPKQWPEYLACTVASISMIVGSTQLAWTSPSIPKLLKPDYGLTIEQVSYIPIIQPAAMLVFTPICNKLMDTVGRKRTLLYSGVVSIISWVLLALSKDVNVIYAGKVFAGIADACCISALIIYIGEVALPAVRDGFGNILMVMFYFGYFLINCVGYYIDIQLAACAMLSFPILFMVSFAFMPETPYYHVMKNDFDAARKSLRFLRRMKNVELELEQLKKDVGRQMSESGNFKDLFLIKSNRKALYIANITRLVQQVSGMGVFAAYAQHIFQQAGGNISSGVAAMIFTGFFTVTNLYSTYFIIKFGKKMAIVYSSIGCGLALLSEAVYFFLDLYTKTDVSSASWFPVLGLIFYVSFAAIGLSPIPNIMLAELFSTSIKKRATTVVNMIFAVYLIALPKLFQVLMTNFTLFVPFAIFGICTLLGAVVCYYVVPDTTGKTLEEIQQMLKGN